MDSHRRATQTRLLRLAHAVKCRRQRSPCRRQQLRREAQPPCALLHRVQALGSENLNRLKLVLVSAGWQNWMLRSSEESLGRGRRAKLPLPAMRARSRRAVLPFEWIRLPWSPWTWRVLGRRREAFLMLDKGISWAETLSLGAWAPGGRHTKRSPWRWLVSAPSNGYSQSSPCMHRVWIAVDSGVPIRQQTGHHVACVARECTL